ncbi:arabinosyltransferase domain-containing protein [Prauserella halophila]|uniref:arabinosyltransferase domain-containing protein n=1 Tax=Prauserella halophila TaxID=185641 RepID=UPI0020A44689|nr:arabinosyltransferase domain-containing protein [Prauserella halophila]MCP2235169.1 arabinosyltransferase C [Prauserella halophila]
MPPAISTSTDNSGEQPGHSGSSTGSTGPRANTQKKWLATILGLVAAVCAVAYPFLPVVQDTARISWPAGGSTEQVNAPLAGYWAQELTADVPCATARSLDDRAAGTANLLSTIPPERIEDGAGMQLRVNDHTLIAFSRGEQVARQPLPAGDCTISVSSTAEHTSLSVDGTPVYAEDGDVRPRVVGIYSSIETGQDPVDGLAVSITPDTRYQSEPTVLKTVVGGIAVVALLGCLFVVNRLDRGFARRAPRWAPTGWWRLTGRDALVVGMLGVWVFIGPVTADDGYILSMARVAEDAGYLTNYHRWFGVAEAPFGWFYHVYELMAHVSTVAPWIRLPSFLLGVLSWLLISREVMPRLGRAVRSSRAAGWAAATVFLVWWMTYNTGTRPEPVAAVGSLLALCAVERALVTRRLLPVCLGLLAAAFTLAATPTGLIAVAPFLVAAKPLFQLLRQRARDNGWIPVLAPIAGAGLLVLVVVFADQTFATVLEGTRLRTAVGPNLSWFQELNRYELLFTDSADGSATRRFPVLLLLLCTAACLAVLLRRSRINGAALGPSRRLIGTTAVFFLLMALTPTKFTHHFGAFAAVGAAMAGLTALAVSASVLRSRRNQALFVAGLLGVAALALTGPNAYWFVSRLGVPWWNMAPQLFGIKLATVLLAGAALFALYAFVENIRAGRPQAPQPSQHRMLFRGSLAFVMVSGLFVAAEVGSMAKAIHEQRDTYSFGKANAEHVLGSSCGLGDYVMVERDPVSSMLEQLPAGRQRTAPQQETQPGQNRPGELPEPAQANGPVQAGFHTEPLGDGDALAEPPHGFTPESVPMWSSYNESANPTGQLRTHWFGLGERGDADQITLSAYAPGGKATRVGLEFGRPTAQGFEVVGTEELLASGDGDGEWKDLRLSLDRTPDRATAVRVAAHDDDLTEDGWVAVTAPRLPTFTTLTERVGDAPVYIDWPASFVYPCLNPMTIRNGIYEMPEYRIVAEPLAHESNIASSQGGGPIGNLEEVADDPEVPSYVRGNPSQAWGSLYEVRPYLQGTEPTVETGERTMWGWQSPGPGPQQPDGNSKSR